MNLVLKYFQNVIILNFFILISIKSTTLHIFNICTIIFKIWKRSDEQFPRNNLDKTVDRQKDGQTDTVGQTVGHTYIPPLHEILILLFDTDLAVFLISSILFRQEDISILRLRKHPLSLLETLEHSKIPAPYRFCMR